MRKSCLSIQLFLPLLVTSVVASIANAAPIIPAGLSRAIKNSVAGPRSDLEHKAGWFGPDDRVYAYDSPTDSAVQYLKVNGGWCTAFMIAPEFALTAGHCIEAGPVSLVIDRNRIFGEEIPVVKAWKASHYGEWKGTNGSAFVHEDFGIIQLSKAVPSDIPSLEIASPSEVAVGERAMSIGYPGYIYQGKARVKDPDCSVRGLENDSILTDCAMSSGNSGGPLLVLTPSGRWKVAGICSTEVKYRKSGAMIMGKPYTDALANRYTNITYYLERVNKVVSGNGGGSILPGGALQPDYPSQCLNSLSSRTWTSLSDSAYQACLQADNQYAVACFNDAFANLKTFPSDDTYSVLDQCDNPYSVEALHLLIVQTENITDDGFRAVVRLKSQGAVDCLANAINTARQHSKSLLQSDLDSCMRK